MIRVLHIITDSNIGGAGNYLLTLIDEMDKQKFSAEAALPEGSRLCPELLARDVFFTEVPHIAERSFSFAGVAALYKVIKKAKPDIVHTHASLSGRVAARLAGGCKIIHTRHTVSLPKNNTARAVFGRNVYNLLRRTINKCINDIFSDIIIAVSPAAKENLLAEGADSAKIKVIDNGTPRIKPHTRYEYAELRRKYNVPENMFTAAQIARLNENKGQEDVLDAAKLPGAEDVLFLLAGDGESYEHLRKRIENEKISNVRLLGFIKEIEEIFTIMDVQICASRAEAISLSLLSGMSLGKPAAAADCSGIPHVIKDGVNGLLFPVRNAEAIAGAVLKLKNDPLLYTALSDGAKKDYEKRFTVQRMALETQTVYESLKWRPL